jgi:phosphate starvation-inducible PhoH-like protein
MAKRSGRVIQAKFQEEHEITIEPKTEAQRVYLENLFSDDIVVGIGSPGTGKTLLGCYYAAKAFMNKDIDKIVITRPNVSMGKSNGALPGTADEKCAPWMLPMLDNFERFMGKNIVQNQLRLGNIILQPMETIRGRSFDDTVLLLDEAQNCTLQELKAVVTRIGENSKIIVMGDPIQNDMRGKSGLQDFCDMCVRHNIEGFSSVQFTHDDIVRSGLVKDLVIMFEKEGV